MSHRQYAIKPTNIDKLNARLLSVSLSKDEKDWQSVFHTHHFTELFFVVNGEGNFLFHDEKYHIRTGDLVIIPPYMEHTEQSIKGTPLEYYVIGVEGISFQLDFGPGETCEVSVSYPYRLGGYPDYDYNVKRGTIRYYLAPAAMWRDFQDLTINLYLDRDMPVLAGSNLDFEKVGTRTYQYRSDSLPEGNLEIRVDQNWFQEFVGTLRSPYLKMYILFFGPVLLVIAAVIIVPILIVRKARRSRR